MHKSRLTFLALPDWLNCCTKLIMSPYESVNSFVNFLKFLIESTMYAQEDWTRVFQNTTDASGVLVVELFVTETSRYEGCGCSWRKFGLLDASHDLSNQGLR